MLFHRQRALARTDPVSLHGACDRRMTRLAPLALALLALVPAGCSGSSEFVRDVSMQTGLVGGEPKPAPDFVTRTRTPDAGYMPIGVSAPPRAIRRKSKNEVGSAEAEMEALRKRNEARGAAARRAGSQ